jgi:hypothetical protein
MQAQRPNLADSQLAGLPKIDDVNRDRANDDGHPVLKFNAKDCEMPG